MSEKQKKKISETNKRVGVGKWMKGRHLTEEIKKKISLSHRGINTWSKGPRPWMQGKHRSLEARQKISKALKGHIPWNKGKKYPQFSGKNHPMFGKHHTEEVRKKISIAGKGRHHSEESRKKISEKLKGKNNWSKGRIPWNKGKKMPQLSGKNCHLWKGGITPINKKIRESIESRLWREAIFARDDWTCQKYRIRCCELHPHHIKNFAQFPELRFALDNGITLSKKAHKEFHKIYGRKNNTKEQIIEFINSK